MKRILPQQKNLGLYLTQRCNFGCPTCIREHGKSDDLDVSLLERVLPDAISLGYTHVGLTGGEPCLHPEFDRVVKVIVKAGATFNFTSNGSMTEKYELLINQYRGKLTVLNFSLDGATEEIHDRIREKGSFDKVVNSIRRFLEMGVPVVPSVVISRINQHQLEDIVKLAFELGVKEIIINALITTPLNGEFILSDEEKRRCFQELNEINSKYNINIYPVSSLFTRRVVDNCVAMFLLSSLMINPRGELVFCCNTVKEGAVVGSLAKDGFVELYKQALDMVTYLRKIRADKISAGVKEEGFDTCEFCNEYLSDHIR